MREDDAGSRRIGKDVDAWNALHDRIGQRTQRLMDDVDRIGRQAEEGTGDAA